MNRTHLALSPWLTLVLGLWAVLATAAAAGFGWSLLSSGDREKPGAETQAPGDPEGTGEPTEPPPDRLDLQPVRFADLPGWLDDRQATAAETFRRSCQRLSVVEPERPVKPEEVGGRAGQWRTACLAVRRLPAGDDGAARRFFEQEFVPFAVSNRGEDQGLFTGYYEPLLYGSRTPTSRYRYPLYRRPPELVMVDLGDFRDDLKGRRIAGSLASGRLRPFHDRAAIDGNGSLAGRDLVLVWVDDPVDAFFLHIQGSGVVQLADGGQMRVGYAAQNGHPYVAIGRELVARGEMALKDVSLQSIRAWLAAHPEQTPGVLAANPSYVFFQELKGGGPRGSQGVVLTPGRSLAVDRVFLPLGAPVWLDGSMPNPQAEGRTEAPVASQPAPQGTSDSQERPLQRLLIAQDTGGAIRGPVRGDVFFGHGEEAAAVAGHMKHPGRLWLLLPTEVAEGRLAPAAPPPG